MTTKQLDYLMVFRADASQGKAEVANMQSAILQLHNQAEAASKKSLMGGGLAEVAGAANREMVQAASASAAMEAGLSGLGVSAQKSATALGLVDQRVEHVKAKMSGLTTSISGQTEALTVGQVEWKRYLSDVRAQFNPIFAASQQYEQQLHRIAEAEEMGAISAREAAQAREQAARIITPINQELAENAKLARGAGSANAYYFAQFNDIGMMAMMGQNPMVLALQQGTQVNQMTQQLGGGRAAFSAMAAGLTSMLNPLSLATIGIIAFGAAGVQALGSLKPQVKSLADTITDLESAVDAYSKSSERARMSSFDLRSEFGSASEIAKVLLADMAELDRRAAARSTTASLQTLASSQGVRFGDDAHLASNASDKIGDLFGLSRKENHVAQQIESAMQWAADAQSLDSQIKAVETLHKRLLDAAGMHDGVSKDEDAFIAEVQALLNQLTNLQAQDENAAGKASAGRLIADYGQQAELSRAILQHGEQSSEVDALRNRHAREALKLKLQDMGLTEDSAEAEQALAALAEQQAAKMAEASEARTRSLNATLTSLAQENAVSEAIVTHGKNSAEVEALQTEHAKENLRVRLQQEGVEERQIRNAEELLEKQREQSRMVTRSQNERQAGAELETMRRQAEIAEAILVHGRGSLQVKQLQIEAARDEYELQLKKRDLSEETKDLLRAQWELTQGLESADPFGSLSAAQNMLSGQNATLEHLKLEVSLIGQSEAMRRRVLAIYQAEVQIREHGIDAASTYADQIREQAVAAGELRAELERQAGAWDRIRSTADSALDGPIDQFLEADFEGGFESLSGEITNMLTDLAIKNPLKNAILGTDFGTLQDIGGMQDILGAFLGRAPHGIDSPERLARQAATMAVTTPMVTINAGSISGLPAAISSSGQVSGLAGSSDVQRQVWDFFANKGLEPHQVAAVVGNVSAESAFNPLAVGDGGNAFGLFQHNNRSQALFDFIGGKDQLGNVQAQLEFAWHELLTSENGVLKQLMSSETLYEANSAFIGFERPSGWTASNPQGGHGWSQRLAASEAAIAKFNTTTTDATQNLGVLGQGFDLFGSALGGAVNGFVADGSGSIWGDLLSAIVPGVAGSLGIPGFASGGHHMGGLRIVGENGPELEYTGASTIIPSEMTRKILTAQAAPSMPSAPANVTFAPVIAPINNSSVPMNVEARETTGSRGERKIELVMSDMVAKGVSTRGGEAEKRLELKYGLKQQGIRR